MDFCLHKRIMFLIYQYMKKESLFSILYEDLEDVEFNWHAISMVQNKKNMAERDEEDGNNKGF
ncbi:hypothetical protein MTR_5g022480 [Medicago truncatula]|uniref:Uncharacterized protein n=1 Tax=Medicago truncatula TaxID=3880 RepID=G7JXJ0_MEDTR|nr:hypothetical protein MTR_5g022480 [Medicago truncatula]